MRSRISMSRARASVLVMRAMGLSGLPTLTLPERPLTPPCPRARAPTQYRRDTAPASGLRADLQRIDPRLARAHPRHRPVKAQIGNRPAPSLGEERARRLSLGRGDGRADGRLA